ncbi:N-acetylmuramoyl-L-alanine amidase [bacterium]|nr:N-acetylmuramoyl-L-alanine amidase [bacterium]
MSISDKNFYNESSALKLGWDPSWFGAKLFDEKLVTAIRKFQKDHGMGADGLCGPSTYRRALTKREFEKKFSFYKSKHGDKFLHYGDAKIPVDWDKVVTYKDFGHGFDISAGLRSWNRKTNRTIKSFVNHWDVCLNSKSCARVLKQRNVSVHFCIDNDGSIIQLHNMNDICWHAGSSNVNNSSVGVEISNAYYPKYQSWYEDNGLGKRPIFSGGVCHGKAMEDFMDFYPVQVEALKALWKAVSYATDVSLTPPPAKWAYSSECRSGKYKGIMNHFNCSKKKIDCANLDIEELLKDT